MFSLGCFFEDFCNLLLEFFLLVVHLETLRKRIRSVEVLRLLKKEKGLTYAELSKLMGLPITVLNRYVKGHVLPRDDRAQEFLSTAQRLLNVREEVKGKVRFDARGYFDNSELVSDTLLLRWIAQTFIDEVIELKLPHINKVLTAAADGIPVAVHIADVLGVDVAIAKKAREVGVASFYEVEYIPSGSGTVSTFYLPRNLLSAKDRVLVVDDIVRSGETQRALIKLVEKAGASLVSVFILVGIGDRWRKELEGVDVSIEILVELEEP